RGDALGDEPGQAVVLLVAEAALQNLAVDGADVPLGGVGEHGDGAHALHTRGDDDVHGTRGDGLGGEVDRLLGRAALTVDGGTGHGRGQPGGQGRVTADVGALRADLADTAHDDVFDQGGRSEEHTSELQSRFDLVCRLLLEKKKL